MYDCAVFIGRFQPLHLGHEHIIREALKIAKRVLILVGSAYQPYSIKNPFSIKDRENMIKTVFPGANVHVLGVPDFPYNDTKWLNYIQNIARVYISSEEKATLIGHSKDKSSYYLSLFPQWASTSVPNFNNISATPIREMILNEQNGYKHLVSPAVYKIINSIDLTLQKQEYKFICDYKKKWENSPYSPVMVTTDAVVTVSGHILLVKRKFHPGKNLLALPGGFIDTEETIVDSCIRELKEECKLKIPKPVLYGKIKDSHVFDAPTRSERGRVITHAFHIDLGNETTLPKIKAGDDASSVSWVPVSQVTSNIMFEDHFHIIQHFTNIM